MWTASFGPGLMFWQKWFYLTPQFVAYQFPGHLLHPHWYFTAYSSICQVLLGALSHFYRLTALFCHQPHGSGFERIVVPWGRGSFFHFLLFHNVCFFAFQFTILFSVCQFGYGGKAYNAEKEAAIQAELEKQQAEEEAKKAAEEAKAEAEAEEKDFDITGLASKFLGVVALIGLAAGGGFYFFIQKKKKEQAAKESVDPDTDYREDEEEIVLPGEEPENEPDEDAERKAYQDSDGYEG